MTDENKNDVNISQPVTDDKGVIVQPTTEPTDVKPDTQPVTEKKEPVPYDRFQEVNEAKKIAEERAIAAEQRNLAYQQALQQVQQPQQEQIDPEGYVQFKDMQQQQAQMMQAFQLQQIRTTTSDLDVVLGANAGQQNYQASEQVKKLIQNNPSLYYGLDRVIATGNPQAISIAYQLVKQQEKVEELEKVANAAKEQSELINSENKTNPMSPAAAGGGGGMSATSQIPPADSPEFDAMWEKVKAGEFDQT